MKTYYIKGNPDKFESAIERYVQKGFSKGENIGFPILTSPDEKIGMKFASNTGFVTVQYLRADYAGDDEIKHINTVVRLFALVGGESVNAGDAEQDMFDSLVGRLNELASGHDKRGR